MVFLFTFVIGIEGMAQNDTLRALFLGNSYTNGNNLPQLVSNISSGKNKILITDKNTPGGYTLDQHSTNQTSLQKIREGNWDYVVLQEQSQIPTIDFYRYNFMYPGATRLRDSIILHNPCAQVVMFMTWGRRFGGQQCDISGTHCSPVFVDFSHMQDSLESAYVEIAHMIDANVAPVGMAWKKSILDTTFVLHTTDNSHPNARGSYLAACVFYQVIWKESSLGTSFNHTLSSSDALYFQMTADSVVRDTTKDWNLDVNQPIANFSFLVNADTVNFTNLSQSPGQPTYLWHFGDGDSSNLAEPIHVYDSAGTYQVMLTVSRCGRTDTMELQVVILPMVSGLLKDKDSELLLYPNPFHDRIFLESSKKMAFIVIYDLQGKVLMEPLSNENPSFIQIPEGIRGPLLIRVVFEDGSSVSRIVTKDF